MSGIKVRSSSLPEKDRHSESDLMNTISSTFGQVSNYIVPNITALNNNSFSSATCISIKSSKHKEIDRQIKRIRPYLEWCQTTSDHQVDVDSLNASIGMMHLFASGPAPIPIAAMGNDGKANLYISCSGFSADMSFDKGQVEYFIKSNLDGSEVFDEEMIEPDRIPPRLLGYMYANLAKNPE